MFPYPEKFNVKIGQESFTFPVSSFVPSDLVFPEISVGFRGFKMLLTSMPKAAVNEDGEIGERNEEIGPAREIRMLDERDPVGDEMFFKHEFRRGVLSSDPGHDPASLLPGDSIHIENIVVRERERQEIN